MVNIIICDDNNKDRNNIEKITKSFMDRKKIEYNIYSFDDYNKKFYNICESKKPFKISNMVTTKDIAIAIVIIADVPAPTHIIITGPKCNFW